MRVGRRRAKSAHHDGRIACSFPGGAGWPIVSARPMTCKAEKVQGIVVAGFASHDARTVRRARAGSAIPCGFHSQFALHVGALGRGAFGRREGDQGRRGYSEPSTGGIRLVNGASPRRRAPGSLPGRDSYGRVCGNRDGANWSHYRSRTCRSCTGGSRSAAASLRSLASSRRAPPSRRHIRTSTPEPGRGPG